jgi:hypothetical protein
MTYSVHALREATNRKIPLSIIEQIVSAPQQIIPDEDSDEVQIYQSLVPFSNGKTYVVRVFVAQREPLHIVTVYRTSKIKKYWRL